jgi:AcrR family transcriptional regulator
MDDLNKTKELIFDAFVELVSSMDYENVSMRDIAHKVGITVASIYNYFKTKASLLEYAYDYHAQHKYDNRKSKEYMKKLIESANAEDILHTIMYTHESENPRQFVRMALISKIIYMRIFHDPLAKASFFETTDNNVDFITDIIRHGIEIGRVDPNFDIKTFADIMIGTMQSMGIKAFADVNYEAHPLEQQKQLFTMFSQILASAIIK